ncbi:hypothetical protein S40293_10345 [Stachybotrys chartarum IBT 40293]|nr:hypothetical protein S40293_10345 [Stachybotrys chartarum IBT 40293]
MVVCLGVTASPSMDILVSCAQSIPLMNPKLIPHGERKWTSRVFLKELLNLIHVQGHVKLPDSVDTIEARCRAAADSQCLYMGNARMYGTLEWMNPKFAELKRSEARNSK